MKRRILSACTALCALVSLSGVGISSVMSSAADTQPVRILAMGDSITDGYINGDNGYRKYLCYNLQQQGFTNFDMVGPNNSWSDTATYDYNGTTITYDPAHAGYSGYAIQAMSGRSGIMETVFDQTYYGTDGTTGNMLEIYNPDMILLQIGTNDLLDAKGEGAPERLEELVDKIALYLDEGDVLFLASIPEIDVEVRNDWLNAYQWTYHIPSYADDPVTYTATVERCVDEYNAAVESLVEKKQSEGMNIRFADINSVVDMKTGLYDGVHPNEDGYACMGQYWSEQILAYLNGTEPITTTTATGEQPTETVTESETVTTEETADTTTETSEETTETEITTDTQEPILLKGDVTLDKEINLADAVQLCHYLLGQDTLSYKAYLRADTTEDAAVNGFDLAALRKYLLLARGG